MNYIRITEEYIDQEHIAEDYTLTDARQHPQQYKSIFHQYCRELAENDPTMSQYDSDELAEENLNSSLDHPYLIEAEGELIGLVVFMDEEVPRNADSCHSYLGEIFVRKPFRNRGIDEKDTLYIRKK